MSTLWKWQEVVCGLLMVVVGVVLLMMPQLTNMLIAQAAAGVLGAAGLVFIIVYFFRRRFSVVGYDLVKAAVLIGAGVLTYLHVNEVSSVIMMALGILILISGILIAQRSIDLRHFGGSSWILFLIIALLSVIDAVLVILNPFANAIWLLRLIAGGMVFAGMFLVISAFVVSHRVHRYLQEKEAAEPEPAYTPQEAVYKPEETVYSQETSYEEPAEPVYTQETSYEEPAGQIPEERPVETEIPVETDLPAEENSGGFRGLFKRKKS